MPKTPEQIIKEANELARAFYEAKGYLAPEGFRFDQSIRARELECWAFATIAYERLAATDLADVLTELSDE